jgi:hypothetical protein
MTRWLLVPVMVHISIFVKGVWVARDRLRLRPGKTLWNATATINTDYIDQSLHNHALHAIDSIN